MDILRLDSSVSDMELGSLFEPWDVSPVGMANRRIAEAYAVPSAFISTNGTTSANFICVYSLLSPGDVVLVERDCHISVLQAINLVGAEPVWVLPHYDPALGISLGATASGVIEALSRAPDTKAAIFTSPKYYGVVGQLDEVVAECHKRGLKILVDEAHGATYPFHPELPLSSVETRAHLITQSTHKTTEALSQGSVVLINDSDTRLQEAFLDAVHSIPAVSTSFNYGIVASVEEAVYNLVRFGHDRISTSLDLAQYFRDRVGAMAPLYSTWGPEEAGRQGFAALDPTRVTVNVSGTGLTGIEVERLLQIQRGNLPPVVAELGDLKNLLFLVSWGNDRNDVDLAVAHLELIANKYGRPRTRIHELHLATLPPREMAPAKAQWAAKRGRTRVVTGHEAIGEVSGETVCVYPPGWAVIVQGERITEEVFEFLREAERLGANLKGATNRFETIRILV